MLIFVVAAIAFGAHNNENIYKIAAILPLESAKSSCK